MKGYYLNISPEIILGLGVFDGGGIGPPGDCRFHELLWTHWELLHEVQQFTPLEVPASQSFGMQPCRDLCCHLLL